MKTKLSLLLAVLSLGTASLHAGLTTDPLGLCGGADDDQFLPPLVRGIVTDPFGICGGADDDQFLPPVERGIVSDPLGLSGDEDNDTLSEFDALWNAVMAAPQMPPPAAPRPPVLQGLTTDTLSLTQDTLGRVPPPPVNRDIESDPFGLWGDNGTDSLTTAIVGGDGADFNSPPRPHLITGDGGADFLRFLVEMSICGGNGNDSLWGGGGTDEIVADDTVDWYK